ncbi:large exoprotein [Microbacterium sp. CFBP9034]|uniref:large exoprotein n=1 Tax=Microbacterium sp. CFBP9034 TaxID=3096540 RepID=UPI002A69AD2C|nr:large exoprotein [Microbacterium sp. CFBP9034]MDY0909138.1 large exoprotein [Microbacterium sp. CFBP9034]
MSDYSDGASIAAFAFLTVFGLVIALAFYVISSWFLMKIFDKAGVQGRWRAWVPIYNYMVFSKLGDLNPWLVLIAIGASLVLGWIPVLGQLIGVAAFVVTLLAAWRVGLKLQKEAVWLILYFFLSLVWLGINAFDRSRWNTAVPAAPWAGNGFLSDRTNWAGIPSQVPAGGYPANPATSPAGYAPPAGYVPPAAPTAPPAYAPPSAAPTAPPAATQPPVTPPSAAPEPQAPPAPPASTEPPAAPEAPKP